MNAAADTPGSADTGRARPGLYAGALVAEAVVITLLGLFGWYFGA